MDRKIPYIKRCTRMEFYKLCFGQKPKLTRSKALKLTWWGALGNVRCKPSWAWRAQCKISYGLKRFLSASKRIEWNCTPKWFSRGVESDFRLSAGVLAHLSS